MEGVRRRIQLQLQKLYPDGKVVSLSSTSHSLYKEVKEECERAQITPEELYKELGLEKSRRKKVKEHGEDFLQGFKEQLLELYPDKIVVGLSANHNRLYAKISNYAKEQGLPVNEFIENVLGFEVKRLVKYDVTPDMIIERLQENYPQKELPPLSAVKEQDSFINKTMTKVARQVGMTEIEFLEYHGFKLSYIHTRNTKSKFVIDKQALHHLYSHYYYNASELAEVFDVTRQLISGAAKQPPRRKIKNPWGTELSEIEKEKVLTLIQDREFVYLEENNFIRIYKHLTSPKIFAILYVSQSGVKCLFEMPNDILDTLIHHRYHELNEKDFEVLKELEKLQIPLGEDMQIPTELTELQTKLTGRLLQLSMNRKEYIKFLGWNYVDGRMKSEEEIRVRLKPYVDEEGYITLKVEDPEYFSVSHSLIRRYGTFQKGVEALGFQYRRVRAERSNAAKERYRELMKHFIIEGNQIYIHTVENQRFYHLLLFYAQRNGMTLNEVVKDFGYERVFKEDLPEGFKPYILEDGWQSTYTKSVDLVDTLIEELQDLVVNEEKNEVVLSHKDELYKQLEDYAKQLDKTVEEIVSEWGYTIIDEKDSFLGTLTKEQQAELDEVKEVQGQLEREVTKQERVKRSQKLVNKMKKLYNCKCQLCSHGEEGLTIPYIQKEDGNYYVEVHHIIQITRAIAGDDLDLDTYKNVIVVCGFHHDMLHYHNGGYTELIQFEDGCLYFRSKYGDLLKVFHNLHLEVAN